VNHASVSAVIPTRGNRRESLARLQQQLQEQTIPPLEVIVISGEETPGKARNRGAEQARGEWLLFLDDDASLDGDGVIEAMLEVFRSEREVGLVGAAIAVPPDAGPFARKYARQFPRSEVMPPEHCEDTDLATTLCCLISADLFRRIGGFREDLIAGEDPEWRDRIRREGKRVVLAPGVRVFHPPPESLAAALKRSYWYGIGDAQIKKKIPPALWRRSCRPYGWFRMLFKAIFLPLGLVLDLPEITSGKIRLRRGGIYLLCGYAHILGYLRERVRK
jgi:GT2 family glycosyltransferase